VVAQAAPAIRLGGVLENAVFEESDVLAAGGIVAAFGEQFTFKDPAVATSLPLPTELADARVFVNDRARSRILRLLQSSQISRFPMM